MVRGSEENMEIKEKILRQHHIMYRCQDGRLWALEVIFDKNGNDASQWVDVTHWSMHRLLRWLGY